MISFSRKDNIFFLDSSIKKAIEFGATRANGAEVNVGSVAVGISDLSIKVKKIQFTNADEPMMNTFEIGNISFQALWDGILRAKVVINEAKLENIQFKTKRSSKGYVIPEEDKAKNSQMTKEVLEKTKKEFEGNILGAIAALISGSGVAKGARVEDNLKSKQKYEELSKQIDSKSKEMDQAFKNLPDKKELSSLNSRLGKIRWKDIGNIAKAPGVLKEIDTLKKDIDRTKKKFDTANKLVNTNIKFINNGQKDIQNLVENNLSDLFALEFVKSEFSIDNVRFDTLAFDKENNTPVIIEYKRKVEKSLFDQDLVQKYFYQN